MAGAPHRACGGTCRAGSSGAEHHEHGSASSPEPVHELEIIRQQQRRGQVHRHSPTDPSCHCEPQTFLPMPPPGSGSLWAPTNGLPPAGGTPAGGKAPAARLCPVPRANPPPRPCDRRGATPERGMERDGPATALQAQPGPVPGAGPEVGGLCLARWSGRHRRPWQL